MKPCQLEEEKEYKKRKDYDDKRRQFNHISFLTPLLLQQFAAKGHSDQDLQPKYAKHWPEASRVAQFSSKGPQQLVKNGFLGHRLLGCSYILVKGVKQHRGGCCACSVVNVVLDHFQSDLILYFEGVLNHAVNCVHHVESPQGKHLYAKNFGPRQGPSRKNLCSQRRSEDHLTFAKYSRIRGNCVLKSDRKGKSFAKQVEELLPDKRAQHFFIGHINAVWGNI